MKILALVLTTLVVGALCEEKCVPGTTFMEDCNKCRCSNDGQKACTRKMCPPKELSDDAQVRTEPVQNGDSLSSADEKDEVHLQTNGQVCTPNEIKMQDCNRCRCANNGIGWFCTRRACPQREKRAVSLDKCTPNTTFMAADGCNTCHCADDGRAACTRRACAPKDESYLLRFRREVDEIKCTPGTKFMRDCNTCECTEQGRAVCSLKFCPSEDVSAFRGRRRRAPEEGPKCTPGTKFMRDCNTCECTEQGRAVCSLKFCPSEDVSAFRGRRRRATQVAPKCTPGTTFLDADGCNTCHCDNEGRAACTLMLCSPRDGAAPRARRAPADEPKCTPGTQFKRDCNTCVCTAQGRAACTLMACLPNREKRQAPVEVPRSEIAPGSPGFSCTPRSNFKYQCNNCVCTDDGKNAGCTFKFCIPGEY